eukprot:TRINITY_DN2982_c0_g1_i1.p1 TRINITY_DN2982_c0_g1~~TRINITY_DN2982_c0_g1_i1.p1  ORF type:complete len:144 (-),score=11.43 TRINITY_DN2982_c0_g1_i1:110-541(-)
MVMIPYRKNMSFDVSKIGQFGQGRVIWIGLDVPDYLKEIVDNLGQQFNSNFPHSMKFESIDRWSPHLTLFKTRERPPSCAMDMFDNLPYKDEHYGTQMVESIDFLKMKGSSDGYFEYESRIRWDHALNEYVFQSYETHTGKHH